MFDKYGPTPRICIDFVYNPDIFAQYRAFYDEAMRGDIDILDKYRDIYTNGKMFDMDEASQTIYFIGPESGG
jgi:hypothetical protein